MEDLSGMTVNERLFALNKNDSFDHAISSGDPDSAIKILESCDLPKDAAISTVTEIFKNPESYGYSVITK